MSFSKLKKLHIIIIGAFLCVLAGGLMGFFLIKPEFEKYQAAYDRLAGIVSKVGVPGVEVSAEVDYASAFQPAMDKALDNMARANSEKNEATALLRAKMDYLMPPLDFSDRKYGMIAFWKEQILTLGPMMERFARDKNVDVVSANFQLPAPPVNPNDPLFEKEVLEFPLGTVAVQGNFKNIMENMRRWNTCNRLVLLSPPTLQGTSPQLQAAYNVTLYIYPMAVAKAGDTVPMAGGGTAAPGAPM